MPETESVLAELEESSLGYTLDLKSTSKEEFETQVGFVRGIDYAITLIKEGADDN